jgi:hypothetical protein
MNKKKQLWTKAVFMRLLDKHAMESVTGGGKEQNMPDGKDQTAPNGKDQ